MSNGDYIDRRVRYGQTQLYDFDILLMKERDNCIRPNEKVRLDLYRAMARHNNFLNNGKKSV